MIHGHSIIELTDVKTGEVERYEDDNIVTNGLKYYLTQYFGYYNTDLYNANIYKEIFSGIKLMDTTLEESVNTIYVPIDTGIVGYAGMEADSSNLKRGLFNQAESGVLEDYSGIKLVWDFAQSQSNGTIACIGITPNNCIQVGYEELENIFHSTDYKVGPGIPFDYDQIKRLLYTHETNKTSMVIRKIACPIWRYGITDNANRTIRDTTEVFIEGVSDYREVKYCGMDAIYYYFLEYKSYDISQEPYKTFFAIHKLKRNTLEVVESKDFVFSTPAYPKAYTTSANYAFIRNNFIYLFYNDSFGGYLKVDLADFSFIKGIIVKEENVSLYGAYPVVRGDDVVSQYWSIDRNDVVHFDRRLSMSSNFYVNNGYYIDHRTNNNIRVHYVPFLLTVNNLSSPVTKTADKTMKITYILKEDLGAPESTP